VTAYPLIRTKWSNEHIMAALFAVLVLYLLPQWLDKPGELFGFAVLLLFGLLIDVAANMFRYHKPVCAVSAAVTTAMLELLTPGVPLWGRLLGVSFALIIGKHIWGGTGKNPFNPAAAGLFFMSILFVVEFPPFYAAVLLVPAMLFSLPFAGFRPFAAGGMILGMLAAMLTSGELSIINMLSYGVVFWGCLVITDPATVTPDPLIGLMSGLLAGFLPLYLSGTVWALALGILAVNTVSAVTADNRGKAISLARLSFKGRKPFHYSIDEVKLIDAVGEETGYNGEMPELSSDQIMSRIRENNVFGFGGAAYSVYDKIMAVMSCGSKAGHLVVNGVECDPGLIHDKWILKRFPNEILHGIDIISKIMSFESIVLAVKDGEICHVPESVKLHKVADYYPVGAEKTLIKEVLGKEIPYGAFPAEQGILVMNVQTVLAVYEAVYLNRKADTRFLTAADLRNKKVQVVRVRLGAKIHETVEAIYPGQGYVFAGGGIMQAWLAEDEEVIDKKVNFLAVGRFPAYKESQLCSKCGLCRRNCPEGLKVNDIAKLVDEGKLKETEKLHAEKCIGCGSCSYVCLAGRNLSKRTLSAREFLRQKAVRFCNVK